MSKEHIHALMSEIGPLLEPLAITASEEEGIWIIAIDEETTLFFDYVDDANRLSLSAQVGMPDDASRAALYHTLLGYNRQWQEHDGFRLGLDEPGGNVLLVYDMPVTKPDAAGIQATINNFTEQLQKWRENLRDAATASASINTAINPHLLGHGNIIRG